MSSVEVGAPRVAAGWLRRVAGAAVVCVLGAVAAAAGDVTAFKQAVAEGAAGDAEVAAFYKANGYEAIWTGREDAARRRAFLRALDRAPAHALPAGEFDPVKLTRLFRDARSIRAIGRAEAAASRLFVAYAHAVQSGVLDPRRVVPGIKRTPPRKSGEALLTELVGSPPDAFMATLPPQSAEYSRLLREKQRLERRIDRGGWGPRLASRTLKAGARGEDVIALRNRLIAMDYMERDATAGYTASLRDAVQRFQADHGLGTDGVAGPSTIAALNISARTRLQQVVVAMERERWLNRDLGERHVLVNITDYSARIVDDGKVSFRTKAVMGKDARDRRTPEFSDRMEHMIVNPTWHVPRSIVTSEYLPQMKRNPYAASQLNLIDTTGRVVPRGRVDFARYNARNFPFSMKQPPSSRNALGLVKFMFPNRYNIYLHDTPAEHLFNRVARDFSHGCIRLNQPFEFAYHLLARQTDRPERVFKAALNSGVERKIELEHPVPVHIIYRTAITRAKGRMQFRDDVYGRDARIFEALRRAGVVPEGVAG